VLTYSKTLKLLLLCPFRVASVHKTHRCTFASSIFITRVMQLRATCFGSTKLSLFHRNLVTWSHVYIFKRQFKQLNM